jgi:glycosyltransferase involved in cell wall biosynthesis
MRISFVCQYFYPEQFRINDICFELVKQGHEITVLTGLPNYPKGVVDKEYKWFKHRREVIKGVTVIRSWLVGRGSSTKKLALNYLSFALSSSIKALFMRGNYDLVIVYQLSPITMALPAIILKKRLKKPLIIYSHDLWPESIASAGISHRSNLFKIILKLSKWIYNQADEIFTSSKLFEQYFRNLIGYQATITHVPAYAEDLFEDIKSINTNKPNINLLFAGNIGEMQSVETIIYAANKLKENPSMHFHIVGEGSSKENCMRLVEKLELANITFHGQHPLASMPHFYEMADAFLVTLKDNDIISYTLPNKVQSYMATGKPIIGAINGETRVVIEDAKCGLCGPAENFEVLAQNIAFFAENKHLHMKYGQNSKLYYSQNFSKSIYIERLNRLLHKYI